MDASQPVTRATEGGVLVEVWVVPGSRRPGFDGLHDGAVRLRVAAPPEGGRANREVCEELARAAGGRRAEVVRGAGSRRKSVKVSDTTVAETVAGLRRRGVPV